MKSRKKVRTYVKWERWCSVWVRNREMKLKIWCSPWCGVWVIQRQMKKLRGLRKREEALKRFEKERKDDEKVWGRERRRWKGVRKRDKFERVDSVWDTERWKCLFLTYFLIFKILRRWHVNIFSCCRK